ncbi:MAG: hypothetical protein LBQ24_00810 [Candidatus Peribacteria bacterium]|jgi:hypothetical protein|nr:hypothetical protein [Candidatus Peribacteria bacterium]
MAEKKETATSNVEVAPVTATKAVTKIDVEQFKKELNASYFKTIKNYL